MKVPNEIFFTVKTSLLNDKKPSELISSILEGENASVFPFDMLSRLKQTEQSPRHHPEGSVWNHTMLVVDEAARVREKSKNAVVFMWTALLHDIGKPDTTRIRKGKITSYGHEKVGAALAQKFLNEFSEDTAFIQAVVSLIRWHMQILFVVNDLPFADIPQMKRQTDVDEVALFGLCDRLGRLNPNRKEEEKNIAVFLKKCCSVNE
ncbi:MAG: HDIG domain-containing protein [Clostridiales bacterium]|jgi:putative nucleotidyltransferase with HDIG domain|nr:HDIG domain-containing protein [Clostridiales bacterium]